MDALRLWRYWLSVATFAYDYHITRILTTYGILCLHRL